MASSSHQQSESAGTGLTFVRPLHHARAAPPAEPDPAQKGNSPTDLLERLFPAHGGQNAAALGPVTGIEIGHFLIEERIGRGGMGAVFRAIDRRLDRVVALKVLSADHSLDLEAVQRFQNEARAAARLDHDNIARVYFIGEEQGLHFIAFEFVSGTNVRDFIIQKGRISPTEAVNYTLQVAEALRHTAAAHVVHRDIKPSNIIIGPTGRAKLVDLGLARQMVSDPTKDLTVAGTTLGTFDYISPEQAIDARNVDVRSDIYSLGCTLYHMLTGDPPYPTGTMFEKVMNHHRPIPPDATEKNPAVSPQLSRVVQRMMASNPDERYPSPESLITDLLQIAQSMGLRPADPEFAVWTAPLFPKRRSMWDGTSTWMAVALVLLLLVFLVDRVRWYGEPEQLTGALTEPPPSAPQNPSGLSPSPGSGESAFSIDRDPAMVGLATDSRTRILSGSAIPDVKTVTTDSALRAASASEDAHNPGNSPPGSDAAIQTVSETPSGTNGGDPVSPYTVLDRTDSTPRSFDTLSAACAAAADGSVIEVHGSRSVLTETSPITISSRKLTIRPAEGPRPFLRFDLTEYIAASSFTRAGRAVDIVRGSLELFDMDVELVVNPASALDHWSMFRLLQGSQFLIRGGSLTIVNPDQIPAAFLHLPDSDLTDIARIMPDRSTPPPCQIFLQDTICRGEADLVQQANHGATQLKLENSALALAGYLLRLNGADMFDTIDANSSSVSLEMQHVTAVCREGLLFATSGERGAFPAIDVSSQAGVFLIERTGQSVILLHGHEEYSELAGQLIWSRDSERNFFSVQDVWGVIDAPAAVFSGSHELDPSDFGIGEHEIVRSPLVDVPMQSPSMEYCRLQPEDFQLRDLVEQPNPAVGITSDRRNAGVDWTSVRLPKTLPAVPSPSSEDDSIESGLSNPITQSEAQTP